MTRAVRAIVMATALAALAPFCSAYYYYVLFANTGGPYVPIPVRFDLNPADTYGLQNNTVNYFISSQGPAKLMPGDTFAAIVNQIRAAAEAWNSVSTSQIRLEFGGVSQVPSGGSAPEIDIVFTDDMPPGLIAQTVHTTVQNPAPLIGAGATFVPLLNSQIQLRSNLTTPWQLPSYSDSFFLTVAHEFGHALGLQHTKTSSLMTTNLTRAVTRAAPLAADDIAGISMLYASTGGASGFAASTGSISGTVTLNGNGVNLATVVALSTSGSAVSTLSNPDGTYQIGGIPPGQYYVYTQPLPPAQSGESYPDNVMPPTDLANNTYAANTGFQGQFYGGTNDWTQATQVGVTAGNVAGSINFAVQPSAGPAVYDMTLYAYVGNPAAPVQAPPLLAGTSAALEFYAGSTGPSDGYLQASPGLNISVIGGAAQIVPSSLAPLANAAPYLYDDVFLGYVNSETPVALAVTLNGDLYVLPSAFTVVTAGGPAVSAASGSTDNVGNATVSIAGSNLSSSTRIVFDGQPAKLVSANSDGSLTVSAPPASNGYSASIEALSSDGQTSGETLGSAAPATFTYGGPSFPSVSVSSPVTAGTDTMVAVTGYTTDFLSGQIQAGFGSSDVVVKQVWVVNPGWLLMNVSVSPNAPAQTTTLTVASGLQTASASFQIAAANPGQMSLRTPILNQATGLDGVPIGGTAVINTSGLPASLAGWTLTMGGQPASFTVSGAQILAVVPGGLLIGPEPVVLTPPGGAPLATVEMQVDEPAPVIAAAATLSGAALDATHAANAGTTIVLTVMGLADPLGDLPALGALDVNAGGIDEAPVSMTPYGVGGAQIQIALPGSLTGPQPVTIRVGTRLSAAYTILLQ